MTPGLGRLAAGRGQSACALGARPVEPAWLRAETVLAALCCRSAGSVIQGRIWSGLQPVPAGLVHNQLMPRLASVPAPAKRQQQRPGFGLYTRHGERLGSVGGLLGVSGAKRAQLQNSWLSLFAAQLGALTSDAASGVLSVRSLCCKGGSSPETAARKAT